MILTILFNVYLKYEMINNCMYTLTYEGTVRHLSLTFHTKDLV